jgi:hypothetical protein
MIQIAALQNQQGLLQSKRAKLDLDIAVAKSESSQVETQMRLIDLEIERQTIAKDLYQRHLHTLAAESLTIAVRLRDLDSILGSGAGGSPDPEMVQAAIQLEIMKYRNQSRTDSLVHLVALSRNKQTELGIKRDQELVAKKANLHREVEILRVERDGELPHEDVDIVNQIWERRSKLVILAPIEKVGHIQISSGPVRPRKTRAVSLLTLVAFLGSLFVAFAWEYISSQREEIFRAQGR